MGSLIFITHPEVSVDPACLITEWALSAVGRDRAARLARSETLSDVTAIWASGERKALQTATYLSKRLGLPVKADARLGENDRTATGFLPPEVFETAADAFFAYPNTSFRGWERAIDAQTRIHRAVTDIIARHTDGDLAIVSHGAVGTLLFCALKGVPISRDHDQPGQGHFWSASLTDLVPRHHWRRFD